MNSVLERIKGTLKTLASSNDVPMEKVYYGRCTDKDLEFWNYFVFNRWKTSKAGTSKIDLQTYYRIHIVHEDYIPEGYVEKVIEALSKKDESGTKLKLTNDDIDYNYISKGNTSMVVEIATITMYHPQKRD